MVSSSTKMLPHPNPPANFYTIKLPIINQKLVLYRFSKSGRDPLSFCKENLFRFNAPAMEFGISYFSKSIRGAFAERFLWMTGTKWISEEEIKKNYLAVFASTVPLKLVNLTGKGLPLIGADNRLCSGDDYSKSQQWSLSIWQHNEKPDGILYEARHDPSQRSIALYERAKSQLQQQSFKQIDFKELYKILKIYRIKWIPS